MENFSHFIPEITISPLFRELSSGINYGSKKYLGKVESYNSSILFEKF
jgi:hypothetical protein